MESILYGSLDVQYGTSCPGVTQRRLVRLARQHQDELLFLLVGVGAGDEQRIGLCPGILDAVQAGEFRFGRAPRLAGGVLRARLPAQREQDMARTPAGRGTGTLQMRLASPSNQRFEARGHSLRSSSDRFLVRQAKDAGIARMREELKGANLWRVHQAKETSLIYSTCCHTFRATGITTYLKSGGTLDMLSRSRLYDRTKDEISLDEVERIKF